MAKKKTTVSGTSNNDEDDFFMQLAEETNGDVLDLIDSVSYFIDTGSLSLNYISSGKFIGGGIPGGKLTEIYGANSSSKSLLGSNILFGCQRAGGIPVIMDVENSANKEFIKTASHCNLKKIVRHTPETLEEVFAKMYKVIEYIREKKGPTVPIVLLYDSISVSPSARELREVALPEGYTQADFKRIVGGNEQPGERAKICSKEFRKLNTVMEKQNVSVVVLNQTRAKIGGYAPMGQEAKTTAGGGNALPFYASLRIETKTQTKIEKKLAGNAKKKKILGIHVKLKNVKNKTHRPFIETDNIQLLFDKGINPLSGLLTCLLDAGRIDGKSGNFTVKEPWAGGTEVKFKASTDRNDVPMELLLKCPALIDATTAEQVQEYLEPFMEAINFKLDEDEDISLNDVTGYEEEADAEIDEELE